MENATMANVNVKIVSLDLSKYAQLAKEAVEDVSSRAGRSGQFLNWIDFLPNNQLNNLNALYDLAQKAKEGKYTDLAILGIGGSRHTTESMMKLLGMDAHIHFYSSVDPESFKRFINTLDLDKTKFLVVSKSGGYLEKTMAYENAK